MLIQFKQPLHLLPLGAAAFFSLTMPTMSAALDKMESVVVTATRIDQRLADASSSLAVISGEELQLISSTHINETLLRIPGVWINRGNGQEHLTAIRSPVLTGAGSCGAFSVAEDGVSVRATGFCNVNQLFDTNSEQAQQIEVLRGPSSVVHGSDALHGVINVISMPPADQLENLATFEVGSNDYGRIKLSHSNKNGQHGYRVNFNGTHDGGYKDESGYDQQKFNARHEYQADSVTINTLMSVNNLNQETAGYVSGKDAYKDPAKKRLNPNPEAFRDTWSARLQSRWQQQLRSGGQFIATPYIRKTEMSFVMHFLPGQPLEKNGQKSIGVQTLYTRPVNDRLTLSNGFDAELTDAYLKQSQDSGFGSFPAGQQYDYQVDATMLAAFISSDYLLTTDTTFTIGARYEYLEYDYNNKMLDGDTAADGSACSSGQCRYSRPADSDDDFDNWSFNTDIKHQLGDNSHASVRLAHGFRAPQATEMYRLQNGQIKAELDPEEVNSIELGFKSNFEQLSYSLTAFYMKKTNVIFQSSERLNLSNGQTKHQGIEYDLNWRFSDHWDLSVAGSYAQHRYTSNVSTPGPSATILPTSGNDVDTAPRHMGNLRIGWQPHSSSRLELEWVAMGKYYTDIDNLHRYSGHNLLNLRLRQQLSPTINLGLRINNLADTNYAERADYSGFGGDRYFVGEPRSFFADLSLSF